VSKYLEYFKQEIEKTPTPAVLIPDNKKQVEEKKIDSGVKKELHACSNHRSHAA
jgi:hypothetical protein